MDYYIGSGTVALRRPDLVGFGDLVREPLFYC